MKFKLYGYDNCSVYISEFNITNIELNFIDMFAIIKNRNGLEQKVEINNEVIALCESLFKFRKENAICKDNNL